MSDEADNTSYDYNAWQARMNFTTAQAADAMGISTSMFSTLKRNGKGRKLYAWAAYGIEAAHHAQKTSAAV